MGIYVAVQSMKPWCGLALRLRLRWARMIVFLAVAGIPPTPSLAAQQVIGQTVDGTGAPLRGTYIRLLDGTGAARSIVLSDASGRFVIRAPTPGTYSLVAEQIGHVTHVSPQVVLETGQTERVQLVLTVQPIGLESISATAHNRCRARPEDGAETQQVWEAARTALRVAAWADANQQYRYRIGSFRRTLDANARPVSRARPDTQSVSGTRPFDTLSADELVGRGFIRTAGGEEHVFYAPDAHVLLSDAFLEGHCFWIRRGNDEVGRQRVGLAFQPVVRRATSDISGVLWLDSETRALRTLEFAYTALPWGLPDGAAGGRVEFSRVPSGIWIMARWVIRVPRVVHASGIGPRYQLAGYEETGGDVRAVLTPEGRAVDHAGVARLTGIVFDSTRRVPLAGAHVQIEGTSHYARTDLEGRFTIDSAPTGELVLVLEHPRIRELRASIAPQRVSLAPGDSTSVRFDIPSLATIGQQRCGREAGVLVGHVRDAKRAPRAGAQVTAGWTERGQMRRDTTSSAEGGHYILCGLPLTGDVSITAEYGQQASRFEILLSAGGVVEREIHLRSEQPTHVRGRVVDAATGQPVAGAEVQLGSASARVVSDTAGRFSAPVSESGDLALRVTHLSYGVLRDTVRASEVGRGELRIQMASTAIRLETITVEAESRPRGTLGAVRERAERSVRLGLGQFFWRDEFEARSPTRVTDLLRTARGIELVPHPDEKYVGHYLVRSTRNRGLRNECRVQIYLDGHRLNSTGDEPIDLLVPLAGIEAVEVYTGAAQVPPEFGGSSFGCGVIAFWSR